MLTTRLDLAGQRYGMRALFSFADRDARQSRRTLPPASEPEGMRVFRMSNDRDTPSSELLAMEGFLNEIQDLIRDLAVVVEINRISKNEHGHLTAFGDAALKEGLSRGTPIGVLARMLGITRQAVWERGLITSPSNNGIYTGEPETEENLHTLRISALLKKASTISSLLLRLRILLKSKKGSRLSPFGREFLYIAIRNNIETNLAASILNVSPSYISLFRTRNSSKAPCDQPPPGDPGEILVEHGAKRRG